MGQKHKKKGLKGGRVDRNGHILGTSFDTDIDETIGFDEEWNPNGFRWSITGALLGPNGDTIATSDQVYKYIRGLLISRQQLEQWQNRVSLLRSARPNAKVQKYQYSKGKTLFYKDKLITLLNEGGGVIPNSENISQWNYDTESKKFIKVRIDNTSHTFSPANIRELNTFLTSEQQFYDDEEQREIANLRAKEILNASSPPPFAPSLFGQLGQLLGLGAPGPQPAAPTIETPFLASAPASEAARPQAPAQAPAQAGARPAALLPITSSNGLKIGDRVTCGRSNKKGIIFGFEKDTRGNVLVKVDNGQNGYWGIAAFECALLAQTEPPPKAQAADPIQASRPASLAPQAAAPRPAALASNPTAPSTAVSSFLGALLGTPQALPASAPPQLPASAPPQAAEASNPSSLPSLIASLLGTPPASAPALAPASALALAPASAPASAPALAPALGPASAPALAPPPPLAPASTATAPISRSPPKRRISKKRRSRSIKNRCSCTPRSKKSKRVKRKCMR